MRHRLPMLSLQNAFSEGELLEFDRRVRRFLGREETLRYLLETMLDGLAVEVVYRAGRFASGSTRGDGTTGEDVSANLRTIRSLPLRLRAGAPPYVEARGEVILRTRDFARLNAEREEAGEPPFANPRNAAAGSLRQLDPEVSAARPLAIFFYGIGDCPGFAPRSEADVLEALRAWGLPVVPGAEAVAGIEGALAYVPAVAGALRGMGAVAGGLIIGTGLRLASALRGTTIGGLAAVVLAAATFPVLLRISAPYGRHARGGWGPCIPAWAGWIAMEAPSPVLVALFWASSPARGEPVAILFLALWLGHYVDRTIVFPFLGRGRKAPMPLTIAASAFAFNLVNGTIQGLGLFHLGPQRDPSWLVDPRCLLGLALFAAGFAMHVRADAILRGLRAPGEAGYRIPRGFLFERVSSPNYLGEIVEWSGWALLTWSLPGLSFAVWTFANLAPRALAHLRWYRERFPDYPRGRRALLPGLL